MTWPRTSLVCLGSLLCLICGSMRTLLAAQTAHSTSEPGERIIFSFQGIATGSFQPDDGPPITFSDDRFTITAIIRPADAVKSKIECAVPSRACVIWTAHVVWANISVAGVMADFTSGLAIFDNQTYTAVGLRRDPGGDLLDLQNNPAFKTYELKDELELKQVFFKQPRKLGQFNCGDGACVTTSRGVLTLESVREVRLEAIRNEMDASVVREKAVR